MEPFITIAHICDIHIDHEGKFPRNIDVRKNFLSTLDHAALKNPDLLFIGGDLCAEDGDLQIYRWVKKQLDRVKIPYFVQSGNHDDSAMMQEIFGQHITKTLMQFGSTDTDIDTDNGHSNKNIREKDLALRSDDLFYLWHLKLDQQIVINLVIDSSKGVIQDHQLNWIKDQLILAGQSQNADNTSVLIWSHHPLIRSGRGHMERKYSLENKEAVYEICKESGFDCLVFSGHFHGERTIEAPGLTQIISPSTMFQIDFMAEKFAVQSLVPGYRMIYVSEDSVQSTVQWLI